MQELILNPNRNHEPKPGDLERRLAQKQAKLLPEEAVCTENSVLGKKRLFSDDALPVSSSN
jgi:hypothetical protein